MGTAAAWIPSGGGAKRYVLLPTCSGVACSRLIGCVLPLALCRTLEQLCTELSRVH